MNNIQTIQKRQQLRNAILQKLYMLWFGNETSAWIGTKEELYSDVEHIQAFRYLKDHHYIEVHLNQDTLSASITPKGKENIE